MALMSVPIIGCLASLIFFPIHEFLLKLKKPVTVNHHQRVFPKISCGNVLMAVLPEKYVVVLLCLETSSKI